MNFAQLQYFIDIIRLGTFSEAASKNHISQSSFSKQIKALENELGVSLIFSVMYRLSKRRIVRCHQRKISFGSLLQTIA